MRLLTVNLGSSSLKLSVVEGDQATEILAVPAPGGRIDDGALRATVDRASPFDAVVHRIVHGGTDFSDPVVVDERVRQRLELLVDLAPLHLPVSLAGLDLVTRLVPDVPAVACFDTAFHATIPAAASTYALPAEWRRRWALRRFGFHGLSHSWATRRAAELSGTRMEELALVSCHLGAGASLAAIQGGVSVDTTMGFTPLEGLVMATRSGSVDPGLVLWLEQHVGLPAAELGAALEHRSGLVGLAGTPDMRQVLEAESSGDAEAALAVEIYLHRLRAAIAAMAAALGGLGVLVFTGGVGEQAAPLRARAVAGLGFLGIALDDEANEHCAPDAEITAAGSEVRSFVITAREDLEMARQATELLQNP